jgi:putative FmdB family regulatory protein
MPLHEYRCPFCGEVMTLLVFPTDTVPPALLCNSCNGEAPRVISAPAGFDLRGAGFHQNDYPKK